MPRFKPKPTQPFALKTKTCRLQSTTGTQNKNLQKSYVFIQWLIKPLLQTRASHSIARSYRTNFDFCFLATLLLSFKVITVFRRHGEKDLSSYLQRHKRCSLGCFQHGWAVTVTREPLTDFTCSMVRCRVGRPCRRRHVVLPGVDVCP